MKPVSGDEKMMKRMGQDDLLVSVVEAVFKVAM